MEGPDVVESPEAEHVPHRVHTGRLWFDVVFSVAAILVSVISLATAIHSGHVMEELVTTNARQASASVWPSLEFSTEDNRGAAVPSFTVSILNTGVGPAKIHSYAIIVDGRPASNLNDLLHLCRDAPINANYSAEVTNSTISGRVLGAGRSITVFKFARRPGQEAVFDRMVAAWTSERRRIETRACYCSVFEQCWTYAGLSRPSEPVNACRAPTTIFRPL
jgi:hypothetical protein